MVQLITLSLPQGEYPLEKPLLGEIVYAND